MRWHSTAAHLLALGALLLNAAPTWGGDGVAVDALQPRLRCDGRDVDCKVELKVAGAVDSMRGRPATTVPLECRVLGPLGRTLGSSSGYATVEGGLISGDSTVQLKRYEGEDISGVSCTALLR